MEKIIELNEVSETTKALKLLREDLKGPCMWGPGLLNYNL